MSLDDKQDKVTTPIKVKVNRAEDIPGAVDSALRGKQT